MVIDGSKLSLDMDCPYSQRVQDKMGFQRAKLLKEDAIGTTGGPER